MSGDSKEPVRKRIFIAGVGGQGTITATVVIGEAALAAGHHVVTSELHGMAQRGGVVQSTVLVGDLHAATILDGAADVLLGFEPAETARFVSKADARRTTIITNTRPIVPVTAAQGRTPYPALDALLEPLKAAAKRLITIDAVERAVQAGTAKALGAVLIGALAGTDELPIPRDCWVEALEARVPPQHRGANRAAFESGIEAAQAATPPVPTA